MKRIILAFFMLLGIGALQDAKAFIIYSDGQTVSTIQELPSEVEIDSQHVNLGVVYKQFSIFWIPIWNYGDVTYAFVNDAERTYWDVEEGDIEFLKTEYNVDAPIQAGIPFWTQVGGKPILVILAAILIYGWIFPSKKEDESEVVSEE